MEYSVRVNYSDIQGQEGWDYAPNEVNVCASDEVIHGYRNGWSGNVRKNVKVGVDTRVDNVGDSISEFSVDQKFINTVAVFPVSVEVGSAFEATFSVSLKSYEDILGFLKVFYNVNTQIIKDSRFVWPCLTVELKGNKADFDIQDLSYDKYQKILPDRVTTWKWLVVPLREGEKTLFIAVNTYVKCGQIASFEESYSQKIRVYIRFKNKMINAIKSLWVFVLGAIVVPLIAALIKRKLECPRRVKRKKNRNTP